jgi:hypothetical protein
METKICNNCLLSKNILEYSKDKNRKDGLQPLCKTCNKEYKKKYYKNKKNEILNKSKVYYENNRENIIKRVKVWGENNEIKTKEYKKKYVENNRDFINKKMSNRKKNEPILKLKMFISKAL